MKPIGYQYLRGSISMKNIFREAISFIVSPRSYIIWKIIYPREVKKAEERFREEVRNMSMEEKIANGYVTF